VRRDGPLLGLTAIAAVLALWHVATVATGVPRWLLPSPLVIAETLVEQSTAIAFHVSATLLESLLGLGAAALLGIGLAIVMDRMPRVRAAIYPILVLSQTVPIIAIAPLLVIWLGYGIAPKIVVVAIVCFFPMAVSTLDALQRVDSDAVSLLRAMGATGQQVFLRVRWPAALPGIFSGLRIGVTYGIIGAIVGEWVGASQGLGIYMLRAVDQLQTDRVFAAIAVAAAMSVTLFSAVLWLERRVLPWKDDGS